MRMKKKPKAKTARRRAATPAPKAVRPDAVAARHEQFAQEYLVDLNATAAYIRVFGDKITREAAAVAGHRLVRDAKTAARIAELRAEQLSRLHIEQDRPIRVLRNIMEADVRQLYDADGKLRVLTEWPDSFVDAVAGVKIKYYPGSEYVAEHEVLEFKFSDRNTATRTLMQHMGLLVEKRELTGKDGAPLMGAVLRLPDNGRDE